MIKPSKLYTDQEIKNIKMYDALPRIFPHELNQGCPICGDYEGDANDCPNGCHDTHEQIMARRVKPQFLIDDDNKYQDNLELI